MMTDVRLRAFSEPSFGSISGARLRRLREVTGGRTGSTGFSGVPKSMLGVVGVTGLGGTAVLLRNCSWRARLPSQLPPLRAGPFEGPASAAESPSVPDDALSRRSLTESRAGDGLADGLEPDGRCWASPEGRGEAGSAPLT
jgi:hypothetical protein